jgi:CubicO group peptidase (beta-lactamase class C family)
MSMGVRMRILRRPSSLMLLGLAIALMAGCKPVPISQKPVEAPPAQIHFPPIKPPPPQTPASIDELKKSVAKVLSKYHIPGVGIALVSKDKVLWTGGLGKADLASGKGVDADTMFRIGSITKGFVALSILQLQAQGKVSLDSKLAEVAPEVPVVNPWEKTDPITVANLLEHTAGFDDFSLEEFYDFSGAVESPLLKTFQRFPGPQHVRWRPGTLASYSNPGYGVAGYLVEKLSGKPCEAYIADNILRPLKMMHSDMRMTPEVKAALAQGYAGRVPHPISYYPIYLRPAGEMKSSPDEMARFVRMMLNRGTLDGVTIVSSDAITRMEMPKTGFAARNGLQYGYALGNYVDLEHQFVAHGHNGGIDGFLSAYGYMLEPGVGYFLSINSSATQAAGVSALKELQDLVCAYLTHDLKIPWRPEEAPLDPSIASHTGFYEFAAPRNEKLKFIAQLVAGGFFYIQNGVLYRRTLAPREELIYLGHNQFSTAKEVAASGVFFTDTDGTDYVCGTLGCARRIDPVWPVTRLVLIGSAMILMATSILFAIIWIPRKVLGRMKGVKHLSVRVFPLLAVLSLLAMLLPLIILNPSTLTLARLNVTTGTIFLASLAFPILAVVSLVVAIRSFGFDMNRGARLHSTLVAVSCVALTWYLAYWGMIGLLAWKL